MVTSSLPDGLVGMSRDYKTVSIGRTLGSAEAFSFTCAGRSLQPYAPVHPSVLRDGAGNITLSWIRRSRLGADWRDHVDAPLNEVREAYEIEIFNGSQLVRTLSTTSPTISYEVAQQITDFGSIQSSISAKIYQLSDMVGRGIACEYTG